MKYKDMKQRAGQLVILLLLVAVALMGASKKMSMVVSYICVGCIDCTKICPVHAITMVNGKAIINDQKCIGCGQCVFVCSFSAIRTEERREEW